MQSPESVDVDDDANQESLLSDNKDLDIFRLSLNRFSFQSSGSSRSCAAGGTSKIRSNITVENPASPALPSHSSSSTNRSLTIDSSRATTPKRSRPADVEDDQSKSKKGSKTKKARGYAEPSVYAHLGLVQDYLQDDLDVAFCGINPGYKSASDGHHFANPTNHFWWCLHQGGFTTEQLHPSVDWTLPSTYNLGLTNLVDRPSIEQSELSVSERRAAVPGLLAKFSKFKPLFVCFVGIGIWDSIEHVIKKTLRYPPMAGPSNLGSGSQQTPKQEPVGLRAYKLVHSPLSQEPDSLESLSNDGEQNEEIQAPATTRDTIKEETAEVLLKQEDEGEGLKLLSSQDLAELGLISTNARETLFFVVPSTSGRVMGYKRSDKAAWFAKLHSCMLEVKQGTFDTSGLTPIQIESFIS